MTETADIIDRYVAVWNEPDPALRRTAISAIWAPGGAEFLEAGTQYRGHEELAERVTRAYEAFVASGKYDVTSAGDAARHDDIITFTAQLTTPAGETDWAARVFLLLGPDGLVREDYQLTVKPLPAT
jgi:hypothetical protein